VPEIVSVEGVWGREEGVTMTGVRRRRRTGTQCNFSEECHSVEEEGRKEREEGARLPSIRLRQFYRHAGKAGFDALLTAISVYS
jgi:hypothetical protein